MPVSDNTDRGFEFGPARPGARGTILAVTLAVTLAAMLAAPLAWHVGEAKAADPVALSVALSVTPVTWNIIGLDSNNVAVGPNDFPVGARVCNGGDTVTGAVTASFVWETPGLGAYINLSPGSSDTVVLDPIAPAACKDAYFNVEVTRVDAAYTKTRRYQITAATSGATAHTVTPRELYVERLISQNRNGISSISLDGTPIPPGGSRDVIAGNTYDIELEGHTATQGYGQLESFLNLPNTVFEVQSVNMTYSANTLPVSLNQLYADACGWDNDPNSPNYRSCIGGDAKAGGDVTATYTVKILPGAAAGTKPLGAVLYDFSGSSYHYNSDFAPTSVNVKVVGPSSVTIAKSFTPKAIAPGATSTLTFVLSNPTTETVTGVHFTDPFPTGVKVASPLTVPSPIGCGPGGFDPAPGVDDPSVTFLNGTLGPNSTCTASINVTAPAGVYVNTTGNLFIGASDTGNVGEATLTAASAPACIPGQTLAAWTVPSTATNPPDAAGGLPTTQAGNVATATASAHVPGDTEIHNGSGVGDSFSWKTYGYKNAGQYVQFVVDTSNYSQVSMSFSVANPGGANGPNRLVLSSSTDGTTFVDRTDIPISATTFVAQSFDFTDTTNTGGTTSFRLTGSGANNDQNGADLDYDNITFTGCRVPLPAPTITKSFSADPIVKGATSTLTLAISNTATGNDALTGVSVSDTVPLGLSVADSSTANQCNGGTLTTTALTRKIDLTGGSLAAGATCTLTIAVTGATAGLFENVTGFVSSVESGTSPNYATDTLTVIAPPVIAKSFSPSAILTGENSTLQFSISNPNQQSDLSDISFTDSLPSGVEVASPPTASLSGCGSGAFDPAPAANDTSVTFVTGTLGPNSTCTASIKVTGSTAGSKINTTGNVTSSEGGDGNAATATLVVTDAQASVDLNEQVSTAPSGEPWLKSIAVATGEQVYYRYVVYNAGDLPLSALDIPGATCTWPASLAPGETGTCVPVSGVPAIEGSHPNPKTVTADYHPPIDGTVNSSSTATYATTGLSLVKSVVEQSFEKVGDSLQYRYLVTNSGAAALAGPVTVTDDKASSVDCPEVTTVGDFDGYLDPGEQITCSATYAVQQDDVDTGSVTNHATARAVANGGTAIALAVMSGESSVTVDQATVPPDLVVTKSDGLTETTPGSDLTYTITVTNVGLATAPGATLTDTVPANLTFVSCSDTCDIGALPVVTWNLGDVPAAASLTRTITLRVEDPLPAGVTTIANTASASDTGANGPDPSPDNNTATDPDSVTAAPDLAITKTDGQTSVIPGQQLTYDLTITNNGDQGATGVFVTDTLPSGVTFASCSNGCVSSALPVVTWPTFSLAGGGASVTRSITVTVDNPAAANREEILNGATVINDGANGDDLVTSDNAATDTDGVTAAPDLVIAKTDGFERLEAGDSTTYVVTVGNVGTEDAGGVVVTDALPSGVTFASCSNACVESPPGTVTWNLGTLGAGLSQELQVTVTVDDPVLDGTTEFRNVATVTDTDPESDPTPGNNTATDADTYGADLSVTKTDGSDTATPGAAVTYTVVVTNGGPSRVTDFTLTETLPSDLSGVTFAASAGSFEPSSGAWSGVDLGANQSVTLTVRGSVDPAATGPLVNAVAVALPGGFTDPTPGNDSAQDVDELVPAAELTVTKSVVGAVVAGATATYEVVVKNLGPSVSRDTKIVDTMPIGLEPVSATGEGWTCVITGQVVECILGDPIEVDASTTVKVEAHVTAASGTNVENSVTVSGTGYPAGGEGATAVAGASVIAAPLPSQAAPPPSQAVPPPSQGTPIAFTGRNLLGLAGLGLVLSIVGALGVAIKRRRPGAARAG